MPTETQAETSRLTVPTLLDALEGKTDPIAVGFRGPHGVIHNVPIRAVRFSFSAALPLEDQRLIILDVGEVTPFVVINEPSVADETTSPASS